MNPAAAGTSPPTSDPLSSTLVRHGVRGRRFRLLLLSALGILLLAALAAARVLEPELERMLHGANGYAAKWVCSNVFVSGRPVADAVADLPPNPLARWARVRLEEIERPAADRAAVPVGARVHASMAGLYGRTAVHRQGYGCTLVPPAYSEEDLAPLPILEARATNRENTADLPFPWGDAPPVSGAGGDGIDSGVDHGVDPGVDSDLDIEALHRAVDRAFEEPDPERLRNTRAVVVVHGGRLVAERYAEGFGPHTPLTGWSMTKTVTNTLVGLLEQQGRLDIHQPVSTPFWPDGDRRAQLDLDVLLRMSSGLEFEESYADLLSDAVQMLFVEPDSGAYAARKPLAHEPDTHWYYSSGTTNLISRFLRQELGDSAYAQFPRRALFEPLGMTSAVLEPDASGTFVGSSFGWATARDWARFGLLYLNDGVWPAPPSPPAGPETGPRGATRAEAPAPDGLRLLPEGWVRYSTAPTPAAPRGRYGAQIWLNAGEPEDAADRPWPSLPPDLYRASGFDGQSVVVVPSHDCVIVRLGLTQARGAFPFEEFVAEILAALPEPAADTDGVPSAGSAP